MRSVWTHLLPGLVVGGLVGFAVHGLVRPDASPSSRRARPANAATESVAAECARACRDEVVGACGAGPDRSPTVLGRSTDRRPLLTDVEVSADPDEQRARLADLEDLVREKKVWTRGAAMRARNILEALPPSEGRSLRLRLDALFESGEVRLQPGAWVPPR